MNHRDEMPALEVTPPEGSSGIVKVIRGVLGTQVPLLTTMQEGAGVRSSGTSSRTETEAEGAGTHGAMAGVSVTRGAGGL